MDKKNKSISFHAMLYSAVIFDKTKIVSFAILSFPLISTLFITSALEFEKNI